MNLEGPIKTPSPIEIIQDLAFKSPVWASVHEEFEAQVASRLARLPRWLPEEFRQLMQE